MMEDDPKYIDDLFKSKFKGERSPFTGKDELWEAIDTRRKKKRRRGLFWFLPIGLLLLISGAIFWNQNISTIEIEQHAGSTSPLPSTTESNLNVEAYSASQSDLDVENYTLPQFKAASKSTSNNTSVTSSANTPNNQPTAQQKVSDISRVDNTNDPTLLILSAGSKPTILNSADELKESKPSEFEKGALSEMKNFALTTKSNIQANQELNSLVRRLPHVLNLTSEKNSISLPSLSFEEFDENNEKEQEQTKTKNRWSLGGYLGYAHAHFDASINSALISSYEIRPLWGISTGMSSTFKINKFSEIGLGLEYNFIYTQSISTQESAERVFTWVNDAYVDGSISGSAKFVGDSVYANLITTNRWLNATRAEFWRMPYFLRLQKKTGPFTVGIELGGSVLLASRVEFIEIQSNLQPKKNMDRQSFSFENWTSDIGLFLAKDLNDGQHQVFIRPKWRHSWSPIIDQEVLKVSTNQFFFDIGYRYAL